MSRVGRAGLDHWQHTSTAVLETQNPTALNYVVPGKLGLSEFSAVALWLPTDQGFGLKKPSL